MDAENGDAKSKMEDYEGIELIGRGSLGAAFLVLHKIEKKKYVLKKIRLSKMTEKFKCTAKQEIDLVAKLQHPYIVEYKDAWVEKGSCICIVTDYFEGGSISERIRKARGAYFPEEKVCKWLTQMLLSMDYLHTNRILHRNIKLSNIMVTKENDVLLGDFGLGKILDEEGLNSTAVGTPNYMCPELLESTPYGYKSDIWSLGCCVFEIAAHQQAFKAPDMAGLVNKINRSLISPFPYVYSSTLKQIIKSMLRKSPEHRPTAAELLRHPHLKPFLLRCRNLPTVFLPVKSPSPNSMKEKTSNISSSNSDGVKDCRETEMKPKQKDLLPLFDENSGLEYLNLLDGDDLIEDKHETKRVDPISYSGNASLDNGDSKSGSVSCQTTACSGDNQEVCDSSSQQEKSDIVEAPMPLSTSLKEEDLPKHLIRLEEVNMDIDKATKMATQVSPQVTEEKEMKEKEAIHGKCARYLMQQTSCNDGVVSVFEEEVTSHKETVTEKVDAKSRLCLRVEEVTGTLSKLDDVSSKIAEAHPKKYDNEMKKDSSQDPTKGDMLLTNHSSDDSQDPTKGDMHLTNHSSDDSFPITAAAIDNAGIKIEWLNHGNLRENALESLLELCARLLKQEKLDELTGVLKAFGDETISSRETAIVLTKSLINAQKLTKES